MGCDKIFKLVYVHYIWITVFITLQTVTPPPIWFPNIDSRKVTSENSLPSFWRCYTVDSNVVSKY